MKLTELDRVWMRELRRRQWDEGGNYNEKVALYFLHEGMERAAKIADEYRKTNTVIATAIRAKAAE